jgi:GH25 family lysozyme M1 (1,4-beta-N-acetylmuramidase)
MHRKPPARMEAIEPRLFLTKTLGIDVSHWQGSINWTSVAGAGKTFAFIKSTGSDGSTSGAANGNYTDSQFSTNAAGATAAGLKIGVYHFADATNPEQTAVQQANYFISVAGSRMGAGYLRPVCDLEVGDGVLSGAQMSQWANDFCNTIYNSVGVRPFIYCSTNYAKNIYDLSVAQWPLWIANWPASPNPETGDPGVGDGNSGWPASSWKFWQYSSTGTVAGISGAVDLDVFNGDLSALLNYVTTAQEIAVQQGASPITDGQAAAVDFGSVAQNGTNPTKTFTVTNSGGVKLTLGAVSVPSGYTLTEPLATSLLAGQSDTFTVALNSSTAGTKTGSITFSTNDSNENPFNFSVTGSVIPSGPPPSVQTASFHWESWPQQVNFEFSEDVGPSLSVDDFVVSRVGESPVTPNQFQYDAATHTATLVFSTVLIDGNYTATVLEAGVKDADNNSMTADYDFNFFHLCGDANHDGRVDVADLGILAFNWQQSGKLFSDGDFNYNTTVDVGDLGYLASNWQVNLAAPSAPAAAPATSSRLTRSPSPRVIDQVAL